MAPLALWPALTHRTWTPHTTGGWPNGRSRPQLGSGRGPTQHRSVVAIFATNHNHAEFIVERFDANYPHLKGKFCRLIAYFSFIDALAKLFHRLDISLKTRLNSRSGLRQSHSKRPCRSLRLAFLGSPDIATHTSNECASSRPIIRISTSISHEAEGVVAVGDDSAGSGAARTDGVFCVENQLVCQGQLADLRPAVAVKQDRGTFAWLLLQVESD